MVMLGKWKFIVCARNGRVSELLVRVELGRHTVIGEWQGRFSL